MTVSIKVGAELDAAAINQQLAELTRRINSTGEAIARAGRLRFEPIPRATLEMAQRIEQSMRNMQRIAPELHRRLNATGQQGAAFDGIDWGRLHGDPAQRMRAQRNHFQMVTGLGFGALPMPPPPLPLPPPPRLPPPGRPPGGVPGGHLPPLHPAIPGILGPAGMPGQIVLNSLNAGRAAAARAGGGMGGLGAGVMGGLGAGLGFAAVQGIGALISGVREHVGAAQQEGIGYADLYRRMGGRGSGNRFNALRYQMRGVSDAISVGYDEVLGLSQLAARRGNLTAQGDLAGTVEHGGGFARSFGFDPSAGVSAFAGLRGIGATRSTDESRRLGLAIAEGIARAGVFAKAEDYLSEIASFGEASARADLTRPNMEGFNEALAGLLHQRIPGLDVRGAAALLNTADGAIRRGGAAGEAGQAFLYQTIGRRLGLDPIQVEQMQEGGLFATGRQTFGSGVVADHYRRNGLAIPRGAAGDDTSIFEMVTDGLRAQYGGGNRRLLANATASLTGLSQRQAMAFLGLERQQMRGIGGLLSEEQIRGLTPTGIQTVGRIASAGRGELADIAGGFMARTGSDRLSGEEADRLRRAIGTGTDDELRKALADIAASRGAEETEGDKTRRTLQGIDKTLQDMATALVGPLNTARDALLRLAGRNGRSATARELADSARDGELGEAEDTRRAALASLGEQERTALERYSTAEALAANNPGDADLRRAANEARAEVERLDIPGQRARIDADYRAAVARANRRHDASLAGFRGGAAQPVSGTVQERALAFGDLMQAHGGGAITENMALGFGANAIGESAAGGNQVGDGTRSSGYLQWNGERRANFRRMFGKDPHEASPEEQARFAVWELTSRDPANTERGTLDRMRAWVSQQPGGDTPENWARAITRFYERPADPDRDAATRAGHATSLAAARRGRRAAGPTAPAAAAPAASAGYDQARAQAAALGVGIPAPMPADAPAGATQAAGQQTVRLEAAPMTGTVTIQTPDGAQAAPPAQMQTTVRPASPYGRTPRGLARRLYD